jgi:hypothetical protein
MENPLTARRAWAGLAAGVIAYEIACPKGELMSEGVDRALETHKVLTTLAIGATALHLLNMIPEQYDPFHRLSRIIGK